MGFGNLGLSELLVLAVLVLVFFGPRRIPEIARSLGGALREFHRGWNEIRRELEDLERDFSGEDHRRRDRTRPGSSRGGEPRPPRGRVEPGDWEHASRRPAEGPRQEPDGDRPEVGDAGERPAEGSAPDPGEPRRDAEGADATEPDAGDRDPGEGADG